MKNFISGDHKNSITEFEAFNMVRYYESRIE